LVSSNRGPAAIFSLVFLFFRPVKISVIRLRYVLFMVLEEEIWFSSEDDAQECSRIFRKLNISAHIRTKVDLESRVQYKATYTILKGIIEEEISRIQNTGEEESDELIAVFQEVLDNLKVKHDLLEKTFAEKSAGTRIGSTIYDFLIKDGQVPYTKERMDSFLQEATLTNLLEMNDLLDIDDEGLILARIISPDDAIMAQYGDEMPPLKEESLKKWQVKRILDSRDIISYIVTTSPDVVFLEDTSELERFFEKIEYDEENLSFFSNIQVKQVLVAEIISMIQKEKKLSREELASEFLHKELPIEGNQVSIGLRLSPRFILGVIDDLKKIGILKGKDSKLKVVIS